MRIDRPTVASWLLASLILIGSETARARPFAEPFGDFLGRVGVEEPTGLPELLLTMAEDPAVARRVLEGADRQSMAITDSLLSFLALPEPGARRRLPELHVVRDFGPPPGERPPTWADVREQGVRLLERVALDPTVGRDQRLRRELDRLRREAPDPKPSDVAGLVKLFEQWWIDRGDDPALTHDPSRIPDVAPWVERIESETGEQAWSRLEILRFLDSDGLRRRLFLDALSPAHHAHLAAEMVEVQKLHGVDLRELGVPPRRWIPEEGRFHGHRASDLREHARAVLRRVTARIDSGADELALRNDWLHWWQRARFEARWWRDPRSSPTLDRWFTGLDRPEEEGGVAVGGWLRELYITAGARELVLEQLEEEHEALVSEIVAFLPLDREEAQARGFQLAYRREPLVPRSGFGGNWVAIPWDEARMLIVEVLETITGGSAPDLGVAELGGDELTTDLRFWQDWWRKEQSDPRWYRDASKVPEATATFELERGRID